MTPEDIVDIVEVSGEDGHIADISAARQINTAGLLVTSDDRGVGLTLSASWQLTDRFHCRLAARSAAKIRIIDTYTVMQEAQLSQRGRAISLNISLSQKGHSRSLAIAPIARIRVLSIVTVVIFCIISENK